MVFYGCGIYCLFAAFLRLYGVFSDQKLLLCLKKLLFNFVFYFLGGFHIYYTHFFSITNVWEHISPSPYPQYILLCILFRTWNFITYLNNFYFVIKIDFVSKIEVLLICHCSHFIHCFVTKFTSNFSFRKFFIFTTWIMNDISPLFNYILILCFFFLMYLAPPPKLLEVKPRVLYARWTL